MNPYYRCFEARRRLRRGRLPQPRPAPGVPRRSSGSRTRRSTRPTSSRTTPRVLAAKRELTRRSRARSPSAPVATGSSVLERRACRAARSSRARRSTPTRRSWPNGLVGRVEQPGLGDGADCSRRSFGSGGRAGRGCAGPGARRRHGVRPRGARDEVRGLRPSSRSSPSRCALRSAAGGRRSSPSSASWQDDRDDALAARLARAGWSGAVGERGAARRRRRGRDRARPRRRARRLLDEATLGAPLCVEGSARHGAARSRSRFRVRGGGLGARPPPSEAPSPSRRSTGRGTVRRRASTRSGSSSPSRRPRAGARGTRRRSGTSRDSPTRALELAVEHARAREQFGAPLARFPPCRPASRTPRSPRTRSRSSPGRQPERRRRSRSRRCAGREPPCCEVTASRTAGARRGRLRARDRPARLLPAGSRGARLGNRRSCDAPADAQLRERSRRHSGELDLLDGPVEPRDARLGRADPAFEGDPERQGLPVASGRLVADAAELGEGRWPSIPARAPAAARPLRARGARGRTFAASRPAHAPLRRRARASAGSRRARRRSPRRSSSCARRRPSAR